MNNLFFFIIIALIACESCAHSSSDSAAISGKTEVKVKFNKSKWDVKKGSDYPYREQMVNDLVYNDTIRSLNKKNILSLLGEPDRVNENYLYYMIAQKRLGFWPIHTKTLVLKFSVKDSVEWIRIHE